MAQCAAGLGSEPLDVEVAIGVMDGVPAEMDGYKVVKTLREHVWQALVKGAEGCV
jgi:hypothetical protein